MFLLFSAFAFAAVPQYKISAQVFVDGKMIASPSFVVKAGESAEIKQDSSEEAYFSKLKVLAESAEEGNVVLDLRVEARSEKKELRSPFRVIAKLGNETTIATGLNPTRDELKVVVKAEEVK